MHHRKKPISSYGFLLVEIILSIATIGAIALLLGGLYAQGQDAAQVSGKRTVALFLAEEGLEALRSIRDESFITLAPGTYGLVLSGTRWALTGTPDVTSDTYTRSIIITYVDDTTRDIDITISWSQNALRDGSVTLSSRITNWKEVYIEEIPEEAP
jgi:type II secretory pathway pseudopilin PulG